MRLFFYTLCTSHLACAWWDGGHAVVGEIARLQMLARNQADKVNVIEQLLSIHAMDRPLHTSMPMAATWMDFIKKSDTSAYGVPAWTMSAWDTLHYVDLPLYKQCQADREKPEENTANCIEACEERVDACFSPEDALAEVYADSEKGTITLLMDSAFKHFLQRTKDTSNPEYINNGAIASSLLHILWLFHLIGDAHMPCHTSALWYKGSFKSDNEVTPAIQVDEHDNGCNNILLSLTEEQKASFANGSPAKNLHALWDSMIGLGDFDPYSEAGMKKVRKMAEELMVSYNSGEFGEDHQVTQITPHMLYVESSKIAGVGDPHDTVKNERWFVYKGVRPQSHFCPSAYTTTSADQTTHCDKRRFTPSAAYWAFAQKASRRLVTLSGLRLANLLSEVVDAMSPTLRGEIDALYRAEIGRDTDKASQALLTSALIAPAMLAGFYAA